MPGSCRTFMNSDRKGSATKWAVCEGGQSTSSNMIKVIQEDSSYTDRYWEEVSVMRPAWVPQTWCFTDDYPFVPNGTDRSGVRDESKERGGDPTVRCTLFTKK